MNAFETAWDLLKSNFYYGTDDPEGSAGRWDSMRLDPHYDSKERDYYTGVNLSHPLYHGMNEEDTIRRIIDSIAHEEGHQAVFSPLKENREMEFEDEGYEPMYYSESNPPNTQQEYGAMLVEGMEHQGIMDELRRRRFFAY